MNPVESALCASDLGYFLKKYVWILTRADPPKKIKWESWDYLVDLLNIVEQYRIIDILKARQLGISWLLMGYAVHKVVFNDEVGVVHGPVQTQFGYHLLEITERS